MKGINLGIVISPGDCANCRHGLTAHRIYGDDKCWMIVGYHDEMGGSVEKFKKEGNGIRCTCNEYVEPK